MFDLLEFQSPAARYRIHSAQSGVSGSRVIYLAGGPGLSSFPERRLLAPVFGKHGIDMLWFDLLGSSESPANSPELITWEQQIEDLRQIVMKHGGGKPVHVISHCTGTQVSHSFMRAHPELVDRLIFISPTWTGAGAFKQIIRTAKDNESLTLVDGRGEKLERFLSLDESRFGPRETLDFAEFAMTARDWPNLYWHNKVAMAEYLKLSLEAPLGVDAFIRLQNAQYRLPPVDYSMYAGKNVLIVQGSKDAITPYDSAGALIRRAVPQAALTLLSESAHWPHLEQAEESAREISRFMREA